MEEASGPAVDVWPDNLQAVNMFISMSTQWRTGMSGPTGLDYNALPGVMRMTGIPRASWGTVFEDLRQMEDAALQVMHQAKP
jgi:hypothetical protein